MSTLDPTTAAAVPSPATGSALRRARSTVAAAVRAQPAYALLVPAYAFLLWLSIITGQWFYADEWAFIVNRDRPPLTDPLAFLDMLFKPHNEHWSTLPVLLYRAVFGVVGLRFYWPYMAVLLVLHLALAVLLIRRMAADGVSRWVVLGLVATFLVYGAGSENILWAFQIGWMGSLIFGLLALEALGGPVAPDRRRVRIGWALLVASLMCSGVGVSMTAVAALAVLLRWGWRTARAVVWVPALAYALWYLGWGVHADSPPIDWSWVPYQMVPYAWRSLTGTVDATFGLTGLGVVVVVAVVAATAQRWPELAARRAESVALGVGVVLFLLVVAVGRITLDKPDASRYSYMILALVGPLVAVLLSDLLRSRRGWVGVAVFAGVAAFAYSTGTLVDAANDEGERERAARDEVLAGFAVARSSYAAADAHPEPYAGDLTIEGVRRLLARGIVPWGNPTRQARALVLGRTSTDVTGQPRVPLAPDAVRIAAVGRMSASPVESGCVGFTPTGSRPQVSLVPTRPASVKVVPLVKGTLLIYTKRDERTSVPQQVPVAANNPVFVNFTDPRNEYILGFPPGGMTKACGLGQALPGPT